MSKLSDLIRYRAALARKRKPATDRQEVTEPTKPAANEIQEPVYTGDSFEYLKVLFELEPVTEETTVSAHDEFYSKISNVRNKSKIFPGRGFLSTMERDKALAWQQFYYRVIECLKMEQAATPTEKNTDLYMMALKRYQWIESDYFKTT